MPTRYRKTRKFRGSRTCGGGSHKKRRGKGSKGGTGLAGGHKHKWSYVVKYDKTRFGRRGFKFPPEIKKRHDVINLRDIEEKLDKFISEGIAKEKEGKIVLELKNYKVLGTGKISKPIIIKAASFSSTAIEKIRKAGGEVIEE